MLNRWVRPAIDAGRVSWQRRPLDEGARHRAVREIQAIGVSRAGDRVLLDVTANGFLYHMVRNIAGTLLAVGQGDQPESWVAELLAGRDRRRAGVTAAPDGLYFAGVRYPEGFDLPAAPPSFPDDEPGDHG